MQDPTKTPVPEATIVLFRENDMLAQGKTDANGLAKFTAQEGAGEYVIDVTGWEIARGELELSAGRRTLTLAEGGVVAGTILVDAGAPSAPMELTWSSANRKIRPPALPQAVEQTLYEARGKRWFLPTRTNADGSFAFRGLAADAAGSIQWAEPYFMEGKDQPQDDREFAVPAPRRDLLLRLITGVEVHLRVVDPMGAALPGAVVGWKRDNNTETTTRSSSSSGKANSEGRFVYAYAPEPSDKFSFTVSTSEGAAEKTYGFIPPPGLRGVWDLGDLATRATRELSVLVQDTQGQPIPGAKAMSWPAPNQRSNQVSDATGHITISIGADDTEIVMHAFGYESAHVAVPAQASEVIATLNRVCVIEFKIQGFTGDTQGLSVELTGAAPMFVDGDKTDLQGTPRMEGGGWSSGLRDGIPYLESRPPKFGPWRIAGLTPSQVIHATLLGGGKTLCEVEIAPLAAGEQRTIALRLDEVSKSLRVRVLSPAAEQLTAASVYLIAGTNVLNSQDHNVDVNGAIEFKSLYCDRYALYVLATGHASKCIMLRPIPEGTLDIVLESPHSVEVELVNRDGSAVLEKASISIESYGIRIGEPTAIGGSRYRLEDLPAGEVLIAVRGGFVEVRQLHDGSDPFVRIVVGEPCSIVVTLAGAKAESTWSFALAASGSTRDLMREVFRADETGVAHGGFPGLFRGSYDVWLEKRSESAIDVWERVGQATPAVIDAEHPTVSVDLHPPG